jgi:cyclophilin family peptidyl-prolyl cis-trans isomerase
MTTYKPGWFAVVVLALVFAMGLVARGSVRQDKFESAPANKPPELFKVRLDTSKGRIVIAVHTDWAPRGAQRFYELVRSRYYDSARFFRIRAGTWVQFGIAGDPKVAQAWRHRTIPDDPYVGVSNKRGTVAFAFKDPDGRTTQVFINLKDNSATHDKEPFVVFGEVVEGMDVVRKIGSTPTSKPGDRPVKPITIESVTIEKK